VGWHRFISAFLFVILTGLPVSATACALICQPGATGVNASHHGDAASCAGQSPAAADAQMRGLAAHDCRSHAVAAQPATMGNVERAGISASPLAVSDGADWTAAVARRASRPPLESGRPRGTPPLTAAIVLRV
jgi:hypothetical protein